MSFSVLIAAVLSASTPPVTTVEAFIAAYNARDYEAYAALLAEDARWYSVENETVTLDGEGRGSLIAWTRGYLEESCPTCRSDLLGTAGSGPFVSTVERASWEAPDGTCRAQTAPAVYEVLEGRIAAVWYFPASSKACDARAG